MSTTTPTSKSGSSNLVVHPSSRILKPMIQIPHQVGVGYRAGPSAQSVFDGPTCDRGISLSRNCFPLSGVAGAGSLVLSGNSTSGNGADSDWILIPRDGAEVMAPALESTVESTYLSNTGFAIPESNQAPELHPKYHVPGSIDAPDGLERPSSKKRTSASIKTPILPRKRTRSHPEYCRDQEKEDSCDDGNCSDPTSKPFDPGHDEATQAHSFACPYFRLDPVANQTCLSYKLMRIRDVKQHLQRRHYLPPFHCPACCKAFPSLRDYDDHIRVQYCNWPQEKNNIEGVSDETQRRLKARVSRAVKPAEQWHAVWGILFSAVMDRPVDPDPYIGSMVKETFRMVRAFWRSSSVEILPGFLESQAEHNMDSGHLEGLLCKLFDTVETQFERSLDLSLTGNRCSSPVDIPDPNEPVTACKSDLTEGGEEYSALLTSSNGTFSSWPSTFYFNVPPSCPMFHTTMVTSNPGTLVSSHSDTPPSTELRGQGISRCSDLSSHAGFESLSDGDASYWGSTASSQLIASVFIETEFGQPTQAFHFPQHENVQKLGRDGTEDSSSHAPLDPILYGIGGWRDETW